MQHATRTATGGGARGWSGAPLRLAWLLTGLVCLPARAASPELVLPPPGDIPAVEPAPAGAGPVEAPAVRKPRRVRVTVLPLSHPDVSEGAAEQIERALSESLRRNEQLDMRDLDQRLSDFAGEMPVDQIELARTTCQKGRDALQNLDLDEAVSQLQDAVDQLVVVLPYIKKQELADAMMALAVAHFQKGSRRATNAALIRLLTWRSDYELDTRQFPDQISGALEDTRRAVNRQSRGEVRINSDPQGAQVFVDGTSVGITPVVAEGLLVGEHYLTFRKIGYKKALRVAQVSARTPAVVQARLSRSEKYLLVKQALDKLEKNMGGPMLDPVVNDLKETLFLDHAVFVRLRPGKVEGGADGVQATAYLYDLRTRELLKRQAIAPPPGPEADAQASRLGEQIYAGVDYEVTLRPTLAPPPVPLVVRRQPVYKKWWLWTAVGAIVAGTVTAVAVGVAANRTPSCPDGHACTGAFIY